MAILGLDLGGTKLATAVFSLDGKLLHRDVTPLNGRTGNDVGTLIQDQVRKQLRTFTINSIGVSVPGISREKSGTVWAPNIPGWEDFPLLEVIREVAPVQSIAIESDRACSIFGEQWQGNAKDCKHAIFMAVGTGIGAGIVDDGRVVKGVDNIAGAVGWLALCRGFESKYKSCGCFEYHASGAGIPKLTKEILQADSTASSLRKINIEELTAYDVFDAYNDNDTIALKVISECVAFWGMAAANLISIFNPEMIIFGGGLFGPAVHLIKDIKAEASKWAQPISYTQVSFRPSALGGDAAVYGAGYLALKSI
jgi:glucokinase